MAALYHAAAPPTITKLGRDWELQGPSPIPKLLVAGTIVQSFLKTLAADWNAVRPYLLSFKHQHPLGPSNGLINAADRLRLVRLNRNALANFLPLPAAPSFLARQESVPPASCALLRP